MTQTCRSESFKLPRDVEMVLYDKTVEIYSPESYEILSIKIEDLNEWAATLRTIANRIEND
jgi:virulence-associated protein VagC